MQTIKDRYPQFMFLGWLGLAVCFSAFLIYQFIVLRLELSAPGLQYLQDGGLHEHFVPLFNFFLYVLIPNLFLIATLNLIHLRRGPRQIPSWHGKLELILVGISLLATFCTLWLVNDRIAYALLKPTYWLLSIALLFGAIRLLIAAARANNQHQTLGNWVLLGISLFCLVASGLSAALLILFTVVPGTTPYGTTFFDSTITPHWTNDPVLYQHLLWYLGHSEISVLFATGLFVAGLLGAALFLLSIGYKKLRQR